MSTNHNRIKVADLETNEPNKILKTNTKGELEFSNANLQSETYNALDCTTEGKALDARQGKILKDMIGNNTVNIASDSETQIESPVPEDYKVVSRSKLFNWWDKIKTKTQTIKAVWNFNLGIKVNNSSGSYTYSTEMGEEMLTAKMVSTGYGTIKTEYGWGAVRWFLPNGLYTKISALTPTQNNSIALPDKSGTMAITNDFVKTAAGITTTPSLIIPNGTLTTVPQNGAIERDSSGKLWTTRNGSRYMLTEDDGSYIKILVNGGQAILDTSAPYISTNSVKDTLLGTFAVGTLSNSILARLTMIAAAGDTVNGGGNVPPTLNKFQIVIKFSNALLNSSAWGPGYINELVLIDNINVTGTTSMISGTYAGWDSNVGIFNGYYVFDNLIPSNPKNLNQVSAQIVCRRKIEFADATNANGNNQAIRAYTTITSTLIERIRM